MVKTRWQFPLLLLVCLLVFVASILIGHHDARQCAIDYPHDGQCGLAAVMDMFYGLCFAGAIFVLGCILIFMLRSAAEKPASTTETPQTRLRRTARVFLFDESGDLLLIRFVAERETGPYIFWVTPGGEVEPNEADRAAAERELFEELGIRPPLIGPVHEETGGSYTHLGEHVRNYDVFFAARCDRSAPHLTGVTADEIALMREARWWRLEELGATAELLFPAAMEALARRALAQWNKGKLGPE